MIDNPMEPALNQTAQAALATNQSGNQSVCFMPSDLQEPVKAGGVTEPNQQNNQNNQNNLILGKFKDYKELEKAYRESEKFISQTREELKEARELLEAATIPDETVQFQNDLDSFLQEHGLTNRAYEFISYLTENPELLSLENEAAFTLVKRSLTALPREYRDYKESLSQMPPALISGQGGEFYATPGKTPKTFEEAGDMFLQMVNPT